MLERLKQAFSRAKQKLGSLLKGFKAGTASDQKTVQAAMQRLRKKAVDLYGNAGRNVNASLDQYTARFSDEEKRTDPKQLDAWKRARVYSGSSWADERDIDVLILTGAAEKFALAINLEREAVYRESYNRTAYEIEKRTRRKLTPLRSAPNIPDYRINLSKDAQWNARKIAASIARGIASGESLEQTNRRIAHDVSTQNRDAFLRSARTLLTGAQNAGRDAAMKAAADFGVNVRKMWIATLDHRTRDAHRELDGQVVDIDKPFVVYGDTIRYPGDPLAKPALVYNCRCTLGFIYPDYDTGPGPRRDNETGETIPYVTYRQWEQRNGGSAGSSAGRSF